MVSFVKHVEWEKNDLSLVENVQKLSWLAGQLTFSSIPRLQMVVKIPLFLVWCAKIDQNKN